MNDRQLRLFLTVADQGSFSKAEEVSFISKQAILRQMNALEEELGVKLFDRTPLGVTLTGGGERFRKGAEELLRLGAKVVADCRREAGGEAVLRVGQVEHQALLHRVTDAFAQRYPDIPIQKVIHPNHSAAYRVQNGITDVGETFYASFVDRLSCSYLRLTDLPFVAAVAPKHPLAARERVGLADLAACRVVLFRQKTPPEYLEELERAFAGAPGELAVRTDVDNQVLAAYACVNSGDVFLTASYFVHTIPALKAVPLDTGWTQEYGLLYRSPPTPAVRKYIDLAAEIFGQKEP